MEMKERERLGEEQISGRQNAQEFWKMGRYESAGKKNGNVVSVDGKERTIEGERVVNGT